MLIYSQMGSGSSLGVNELQSALNQQIGVYNK